MKKCALKILLIIETFIIALGVLYVCYCFIASKKTELYRETSPNGEFRLIISEIGTPDWPFGYDHLRVALYGTDGNDYRASFRADVANKGMQAGFEVEWLEDSVQITLIGSGQPTAYYILPFKTEY